MPSALQYALVQRMLKYFTIFTCNKYYTYFKSTCFQIYLPHFWHTYMHCMYDRYAYIVLTWVMLLHRMEWSSLLHHVLMQQEDRKVTHQYINDHKLYCYIIILYTGVLIMYSICRIFKCQINV